MKIEETKNINSKLLELQQKLRNVELAIDLYEKDLYKIDKRLEKIENEGEESMTKEKEVKDRINAYVEETWRCWIDQEASMKKNGLKSMFEQILEDGKEMGRKEKK